MFFCFIFIDSMNYHCLFCSHRPTFFYPSCGYGLRITGSGSGPLINPDPTVKKELHSAKKLIWIRPDIYYNKLFSFIIEKLHIFPINIEESLMATILVVIWIRNRPFRKTGSNHSPLKRAEFGSDYSPSEKAEFGSATLTLC